MNKINYISLGILAVIFLLQIIKRYLKFTFLISIFLIFAVLIYWTISQYLLWKNPESPSFYLLPPYQNISYFIYYVFFRFWLSYLISLFIALLAFAAIKYFNKKYQEKFFYNEEHCIIPTVLFLLGQPLWIFYIIAVLLIWLFLEIRNQKLKIKAERISFYWFWIPIAILVIIIKGFL